MALPFLIALTAFIYLKPQEFFPVLSALPILHVLFVLLVAGAVLDVARGAVRGELPPQAPFVLLFALWALLVIALRDRSSIPRVMTTIGIGTGIYLAGSVAMGTPRRVWVLASVLLGLSLFLATVGAHQAEQPFACFALEREDDTDAPIYDGRPCETFRDCEEGGVGDVDWLCERPGLFGTSSIGHGRVRYRGSLSDPNELALVVGTAMPFAFALLESKRARAALAGGKRGGSIMAVAILGGLVALFGWCVVKTESRGGQIVFAAVLGLFFMRRFRMWGVLLGALSVFPILLWGGRSGAEADASAMERVEAWYEGITMFRDHPLIGVGPLQFVEHHALTAHNAYVLVAAEQGFVGLFLFSLSIYATVKIPWSLWYGGALRTDPSLAPLAPALLIAMVGMMIGIFFLSFAYHHVLYLFMSLAGALAAAAARAVPGFRVRVSLREAGVVALLDAVFVVVMFGYTRLKVGG
jgi:O-Antigen ligase